jgi:hypothetical protein
MSRIAAGVLTFAIAGGSMAAAAQEVLDYQGLPFTNMTVAAPGSGSGAILDVVTSPLMGSITLAAPLGDNLHDAVVDPTSVNFSATPALAFFPVASPDYSYAFMFSTNNVGAITGWSFSISNGTGGGSNTEGFVSYTSEASGGTGEDSAYSTLTSPYINPITSPPGCCESSGYVDKPGSWTLARAVPEIDPASSVGGLTLLLGGLAIACGRRPARRWPA